MKTFFYCAGVLLLLFAGAAFYIVASMPAPTRVDFDATGILWLLTSGPRLFLSLVGILLVVGGVYCFLAPRLPRYRALLETPRDFPR